MIDGDTIATVYENIPSYNIKGIVHFEINFWYVLSYLKGSKM